MPASSEVIAGSVSVPPFTTLLCGRLSLLVTQVSSGGGSPPVVMHTSDTVWPGFTTIGSSTSSLMDGEAVEEESLELTDWQKMDNFGCYGQGGGSDTDVAHRRPYWVRQLALTAVDG